MIVNTTQHGQTQLSTFESLDSEDMAMASKNLASSTAGWGNCPADILMMVFEKLDGPALINCISVNSWWRDIVDFYGQHNSVWREIAQEGITNRGTTFRTKSVQNWRNLYFNSRLWFHVTQSNITLHYLGVTYLERIRYLQVYKDALFVLCKQSTECYKIDDTKNKMKKIASKKRVHEEWTDTTAQRWKLLADSEMLESNRMINKLIEESPFTKVIVLGDNYFYLLDERNVLWSHRWDEEQNKWEDRTLARYYGCNRSISDIHIYNNNVYMLLKSGVVLHLDREGRNFETEPDLRMPLTTMMRYMRLLHMNLLKTRIDKVFDVGIPEYTTGQHSLFQKFSAVVSVPSDMEFKINSVSGTEHMVIECPDLTCSTEHGDVLLLGYKDGTVQVCIPKNFISNGGEPEMSVNIQDFDAYIEDDPAVVAIDVYEALQSHHIFVATRCNIYKLVITYPHCVKESIGIYDDIVL